MTEAVSKKDRMILRQLGEKIAEISSLPVHATKAELWRKMNCMENARPVVWIIEIPWDEMGDELSLQTEGNPARRIEEHLRRIIYQWEHFPGDMTVDPVVYCQLVMRDSGYGLEPKTVATGCSGGAMEYVPIINTPADIDKIQMPTITYDAEATEREYQFMQEVFDGVIPVEKRGVTDLWCAPWDELVMYWGIQKLFMDMMDNPQLVHYGIRRITDAWNHRLDQLEQLNLLALNNIYCHVGSGGPGFTDELPQEDCDRAHVRLKDRWGCSTAQIFSEVSPAMHEEFALQYEKRLLDRFGLTYYGCCEPLHNKLDMLDSITNLRRISISPWCDLDIAVEKIKGKYCFSYKPNPAILASQTWNPDLARQNLQDDLQKIRGCHVEVIMKDISTVRNQPHRLWEWEKIAMEVVGQFE